MVSGVQEVAWGGVVHRVFLVLMLAELSSAAGNDLPLAFGLASGSTNLQIRLRAPRCARASNACIAAPVVRPWLSSSAILRGPAKQGRTHNTRCNTWQQIATRSTRIPQHTTTHFSRVRGRGVHCECSCTYLCVLCVAVYLYDPGILFCMYTYNSMCKCPHKLDFRTRQRGATALCGTQLHAQTDGPDAGVWGGYH